MSIGCRNWFNENKVLAISALVLILCMGIGCMVYILYGHRLIKEAYEERSIGFLNRIIEGRDIRPLEHYYNYVDKLYLMINLIIGAVVFYIIYSVKLRPDMKLEILVVYVIVTVGGFYFATIREGHNWGGDFSLYIHHAKNIAERIEYEDTGYIYNPSHPSLSPRTYPPIFPLLLLPVYKFFGLNLMIMKIEVILFFLMSLFTIFLVFRTELSSRHLLMMIIAIGFNPYFWDFKDNILSDIPFLFFTYLSIFFINRAYQVNHLRGNQTLYSILVGTLIYLSYGTRSIGIVLIPSLLIYDIIELKRPSRFTIRVILLFVFLMVVQNAFLRSESSYFDQFEITFKVIFKNLVSYNKSLAFIWYNGYSIVFTAALFLIVSALALLGCLTRIKNKVTIFEIFLVLYMAIVIVWPANQGTRFLIPVIPLYLFYAFSGIEKLGSFKGGTLERVVLIALVAAIFFSYATRYEKMDYGSPIREGVAEKEAVDLFHYIKQATDGRDVFIFRKPRVLSLFTGRRASVYHQPEDDGRLWDYFGEIKATHVIVMPSLDNFLCRFVEKYEDRFQEVYSNPQFKVFSIVLRDEVNLDLRKTLKRLDEDQLRTLYLNVCGSFYVDASALLATLMDGTGSCRSYDYRGGAYVEERAILS